MATNYNIKLKRFNGTDFDTLFPNTTIEQVTGSLPTNRLSGTIAKNQIASGATYTSTTVTLSTTWTNNTQTISVPSSVGITSTSLVIISPAPNSFLNYGDSGIYCSAQGTNSLTFTCQSPPSSSLTVNVVKLT